MTKREFVAALRSELKKLPPEEIEAAVEFYEEYFAEVLESGKKTEAEVVEELGDPKRVAAQIKAEYAARVLDGDEDAGHEKANVKKKLSAIWWVVIGIVSAPVSLPAAGMLIFVAALVMAIVIGVLLSVYGLIIGCAVMALISITMGILSVGTAASAAMLFFGAGAAIAAASAAAGVGAARGTRALIRLAAKGVKAGNERGEKHE